MPKIRIDHIISFSSEDPVHVASNILSNDTSKKWKCRTPGEKSAIVFLQLEKATLITGIDIGNEHSAYVEVLVSRSGINDDYKVLLVTSSFMTPLEARQSQNINKVRMFTKEHFSKPECDEKWDRVKVVCTQPFNKHVQYGLSFINVHTSDEKAAAPPVQAHIGKFILRPDSPDNISVGSLFEKRKEVKEEKLTGAAAIREASSSASLAIHGSPVCKRKVITQNKTPTSRKDSTDSSEKTPKPRNRNDILYSKDEEEPNEKIDKIIEQKTKEAKEKEAKMDLEKTPKPKRKAGSSSNSSKKQKDENVTKSPTPLDIPSHSKAKAAVAKKDHSDRKRKNKGDDGKNDQSKKIKNDANTKPFARLLEDVTLVISGIQNPDRGCLRTSALCMGAKYKPDWDATCTHLICAFPNTPKFNQVRGKGKIVKKTWIEDCYSQKKRLPWRRYALDRRDIGKDESEDEICAKVEQESPVHEPVESSDGEMDYDEHKDEASDTEERITKIQERHKNKGKENENLNSVFNADTDAASDTEDRIASIQALQKDKKSENLDSIYNADTDEEDLTEKKSSSITNKLKNLFDGKRFYVDQTFGDDIYYKLCKYIVAYNGKPSDDPTGGVDVIIGMKENSQTLKEVNSNAVCLYPEWVWECHNNQKLVPMDPYMY